MTRTTTKNDIFSSFKTFHPDSRIWIYQADRELEPNEIQTAEKQINEFAHQWKVHGKAANAVGELLFGRFVLFSVDNATPASGCSIDESVNFITQLGKQLEVDFFNRLTICFVHPEEQTIHSLPLPKLKQAVKAGELPADLIIFDNTITTLQQLDGQWMIPANESWLVN